jgi:hypothetical protein
MIFVLSSGSFRVSVEYFEHSLYILLFSWRRDPRGSYSIRSAFSIIAWMVAYFSYSKDRSWMFDFWRSSFYETWSFIVVLLLFYSIISFYSNRVWRS